tara:strand:+ start:22961 stop:23125 length:165 start_codon:yes stop_codon:yes gene_type:complete
VYFFIAIQEYTKNAVLNEKTRFFIYSAFISSSHADYLTGRDGKFYHDQFFVAFP